MNTLCRNNPQPRRKINIPIPLQNIIKKLGTGISLAEHKPRRGKQISFSVKKPSDKSKRNGYTWSKNHPHIVLALFMSLVGILSQSAHAEGTYSTQSSPRAGISISLPSELVRVPQRENNTIVLFAHSYAEDWPTLTITRHPGRYQPATVGQHHNRILRDYQNVGFADARLIGTYEGRFKYMPKERHAVNMSYTSGGQKLLADVTYVSAENSHFIITYTDTPTGFSRRATMRERILTSFQINRNLLARPVTRVPRLPSELGASSGRRAEPLPDGGDDKSTFNRGRPDKGSIIAVILLVVAIVVGSASMFRQDTAGKSGGGEKKSGNG